MATRASAPSEADSPVAGAAAGVSDPDAECKAKQEELKAIGNRAFAAKDFAGAIARYTEAIELGVPNHLLYANRSAAHCELTAYADAVKDAEMAVEIAPHWVKGYLRLGKALSGMGRHLEAVSVFETAYARDPKAGVRRMLEAAQHAAAVADVSRRPSDLDDWHGLFKRLQPRMRLCSLAHFWNQATKADRYAILGVFLDTLSSTAGGPSLADFQEDKMLPLPLDNYSDIEFPEPWLEFFRELLPEQRVELFQRSWDEASETERGLIKHDVQHFVMAAHAEPVVVDSGDEGDGESDGDDDGDDDA